MSADAAPLAVEMLVCPLDREGENRDDSNSDYGDKARQI
jgi:hypothetical protein